MKKIVSFTATQGKDLKPGDIYDHGAPDYYSEIVSVKHLNKYSIELEIAEGHFRFTRHIYPDSEFRVLVFERGK